MGLVKLALSDAAITFLWVIYINFMKPVAVLLAATLGLRGYEFYIVLGLLALNVFVFSWLGGLLGGAIWNPTPVLAFYSLGVSRDSLFSIAVRYPAQAIGAVGGLLSAKELVPASYKHLLGGPKLMVDSQKGIIAEMLLTFLITFSVLFAVFKGPKSKFWKNWIIILATYAVIILGSTYTGPALNPAHAFAWAYVNEKHNELEHLLVYWLAPLAGSLAAALTFRKIFPAQKTKEKAA